MKLARVVFRVARGIEVRFSQGICRLSVPVLSEGPLYFQLSTLLAFQGLSHFWAIACPIYSQSSTLYSLTAPW